MWWKSVVACLCPSNVQSEYVWVCVCTDLKELLCVSFGDSERVAYTKFSPVEVMVLSEKPHCSFDNETPLLNGIARRNVPSWFSVPLSFSLSLSHSQVHAHTFLPLYPHTCPEPCCLVALPLALTPSSSLSSHSLPDLSHTLSLDHGQHARFRSFSFHLLQTWLRAHTPIPIGLVVSSLMQGNNYAGLTVQWHGPL